MGCVLWELSIKSNQGSKDSFSNRSFRISGVRLILGNPRKKKMSSKQKSLLYSLIRLRIGFPVWSCCECSSGSGIINKGLLKDAAMTFIAITWSNYGFNGTPPTLYWMKKHTNQVHCRGMNISSVYSLSDLSYHAVHIDRLTHPVPSNSIVRILSTLCWGRSL